MKRAEYPGVPPRHVDCKMRCSPVPLSAGSDDPTAGPEDTYVPVKPATGDEAGDPFDPDDDGPYLVHGVALPEDGLTFGKDEQWTFWPENVGREAEGLLIGRNIVDNHPEEVRTDDVIGEVTGEKYIDGLGLAWHGEVDNRAKAKQIHRGRLDSSPYLYAFDGGDHDLPDDAPDGTRVASSISSVRDIGMVADGAIHGSEVSPGLNPKIEDGSAAATALSQAFGDDGRTSVMVSGGESESMSEDDDSGGGDDPTVDDLRERIEDLESENETLRERNKLLREPYVRSITEGTDLDPDDVNLTAEDLAERFAEDADGENEDGEGATVDDGSEEATALSAAPLTAARGSPPGEGEATALSAGEGGDEGNADADVPEPDADAETLKQRREVMSGRGTDEYREKLDKQIAAAESGGGS